MTCIAVLDFIIRMSTTMSTAEILHEQNPFWRNPRARLALDLPFRRFACKPLLDHITRAQRRAAVLLGPRQVGKTRLLFQIADDLLDHHAVQPPNITYFDF